MIRHLSRRIAGLLLLPFLILTLGLGIGGWHCADGTQCKPAVSLACCCGCVEAGAEVAHHCADDYADAIFATDQCGCYYDGAPVDTVRWATQLAQSQVATLPAGGPILVPPQPQAPFFEAAATGSPPRYLVSTRDTRAPPTA